MLCVAAICMAQNVTVKAVNEPAATVFRTIVEQTGLNFVYSSDLLRGLRVSVDVHDKSLEHTLSVIFKNTDIVYEIRGKNIILRRPVRQAAPVRKPVIPAPQINMNFYAAPEMLEEVVVVSRLEAPAVETPEIGARKLSGSEIARTPVLFGESDVLKALQMQPGISGGSEGMAEMHVHGGNSDENMFMLDNVPLYQVNHFAGLFSAFNVDAIRYIDFFKSSIPAKYDGRLSSYLDVRTKDGAPDRSNGSFRLGLTSGALSLNGPIGRRTSYSLAVRRSWFDALSAPILAIANSSSDTEKIRFRYAFMDLNGKITHRFNSRATGFVSVYFGDDLLKTGSKDSDSSSGYNLWYEDDRYDMHWGNLVARAGFNYRLRPSMTAEFTAAYTRFFSGMKHVYYSEDRTPASGVADTARSVTDTDNNINDWIFRGDFDWNPSDAHRVRFGAGYTRHSFLPARTTRTYSSGGTSVVSRDSTVAYRANEANVYIEDDYRISDRFRVNAGIHGSLFSIDGRTHFGIGPRLSAAYRPSESWAVKVAYARTNQYVHQLCQTYLALPTDQWIPITGKFKPQTADKISAGVYWQTPDGQFNASAEGFWKSMRNLVDYRDEYYLRPPMEMWTDRLCSGRGTAKGLDLKFEKTAGRLTGHIAYTLAWSDRTFPDKNGGCTFPARFDNRHTINILLNYKISGRVSLSAAWTGHSGNRFTLLPQVWESPGFEHDWYNDFSPLKTGINNYRLPFYHRLDLSLTVRNNRGYWNISLYNAYCHLNTVAVRRTYDDSGRPVFQKVRMLPIIPSVSYTWQF